MTPFARSKYFTVLWPAACEVCDWNPKDDAQRRAIVLECMRLVRGPAVTTSSPRFGPDEVTALFTFLEHLADPASLDKSARWVTCQEDYRTFNRARQADYHERALYGSGKNKWDRNRFRGAASAKGGPLDSLDPKEVSKRHMTFASRHQKKERAEKLSSLNRKDHHAPGQKAGSHKRTTPAAEEIAAAGTRAVCDILDNPPAPRVIPLPPPRPF